MTKDLNRAIKLCKEAIEIFDTDDTGLDVYYSNFACEIRKDLYSLVVKIESVLSKKKDGRTILTHIWDAQKKVYRLALAYETFAQERTFKKAEEYYEKIIYTSAKLYIIETYVIRHIHKPS